MKTKMQCICGGEVYYDVTTYEGTYYCKKCGRYANTPITVKTIVKLMKGRVVDPVKWREEHEEKDRLKNVKY